MQVIPAIDLRGGRCVRLIQGDFAQETVFGEDPIMMALKWELMGAERLHVVDLDGARDGEPLNVEIIADMVKAVKIPIQLGGGVRTMATAERMLALGLDRVIVGTSAALDKDLAASLFKAFGEHVVIGLDANHGNVAIHGWQKTLDIKAIDLAKELESLGACRIIHTDISTDGMMKGVNLPAMEAMARAVNIPVIASGGVTTLNDIANLQKLEPLGIEGAIVGKVLYTHLMDLREAIEVGHGIWNADRDK